MSDIEREEFEQAVTDRWSDSYKFTRFGDEDYYDEVLEGMWWGWQAGRQDFEGDGVRGYSYELARSIENGKYCDFALHISRQKPSVPVGSIRNLEPLYTHPASADVPEKWRTVMKELADDLESEVEARRSGELDRRIERDLIVVKEARVLLDEQEQGDE
jgi:hypothetical protein